MTSKKRSFSDWRDDFLRHLKECGTVVHACAMVDISRTTAYRYRDQDPDFAGQWDECIERAIASVEASVIQRARDGTQVFVTHQGEVCYHKDPDTGELVRDGDGTPIPITERKFETALSIFTLKRRLPAIYGDSVGTEDEGVAIELPVMNTPEDIRDAIRVVREAFNQGKINASRMKALCESYSAELAAIVAIEQDKRIDAMEAKQGA